jgi:hypothetical protein
VNKHVEFHGAFVPLITRQKRVRWKITLILAAIEQKLVIDSIVKWGELLVSTQNARRKAALVESWSCFLPPSRDSHRKYKKMNFGDPFEQKTGHYIMRVRPESQKARCGIPEHDDPFHQTDYAKPWAKQRTADRAV